VDPEELDAIFKAWRCVWAGRDRVVASSVIL